MESEGSRSPITAPSNPTPPPDAPKAARPSIQRLVITKMALENFKSYAGVQEIGPFHKKFTAIVGPNGSGKSNVIDAMLFVFGKKAKQIRLDKLSALIHKSDQFPDLRHAKVTVFFQELIDYEDSETDYELVAGTEMTLSRTCYVSNASQYEMNGKKSSYGEVTSTLKKVGVDLDHNRFLILQGEVESIALMKPKAMNEHEDGLLEYIEDIAGTGHYKPKIDEGEKAVENYTEEREMHMKRVQASEKDRDAISGAKEEAERYLRLDTQVCKTQTLLIQCKTEEMKGNLANKEKELRETTEEAAAKKKESEQGREKISELEGILKGKKKQADGMLKGFEKLQEDVRILDAAATELRAAKQEATKRVKQQSDFVEKQQAEVTKLQKQNTKLTAENKDAATELEILEPKIEGLQEEFDRRTESLTGACRPLNEKLSKLQAELTPLNEALKRAENETKLAGIKRKGLSQGATDIRSRVERTRTELQEKKDEQARLSGELKDNREEFTGIQTSMGKDKKSDQAIKDSLPRVKAAVQKNMTMVDQLRSTTSKAVEGSKLSKALAELQKEGGMEGYYGRLGDLGTIDAAYDVPISTCARGPLDHLVCDGEATAKRILAFLKKNTSQRANIVLLDKQDVFREKLRYNGPSPPPGTARLFDQIKPMHPKYACVFYWAVRETLVAENLEAGTKAAFAGGRRNRVVTFQGQMIETTGLMTGGGTQLFRGAMGQVGIDQSEIGNLNEKLATAQAEYKKVSQDERRLLDKVAELDRQTGENTRRLRDLDRVAKILLSQVRSAEGQVKVADTKLRDIEIELQQVDATSDPQAVANADREVEEAKDEVAKRKVLCVELQDSVEITNRELADVGGAEYSSAKEVLKMTKTQLTKATDKRDKSASGLKEGAKKLDRARGRLEAAKQELDDAKQMERESDSGEMQDGGKLKEAKTKLTDTKKKFDEAKAEVGALEAERESEKEKVQALRKVCADAEHKAKEREKEYTDIQQKQNKLVETLQRMHDNVQRNLKDYGIGVLDPTDVPDPDNFVAEEFTLTATPERVKEIAGSEENMADLRAQVQCAMDMRGQMDAQTAAIKEWTDKNKVYLKRYAEFKDVNDKRTLAVAEVDALKKQRHQEFMEAFRNIRYKLKEMYQMLTMGGDAELELVDTFDPFSEGLQFSVRPPRKAWKNITNLSGGEKTLSSLALVFALHHFKPTPLYVMDEIDAALDFKNVSIVANYVKSAARNAQFIIISLRNNMFELANRLVGVYKTEDCTGSLAVNPACYRSLLPAPPAASLSVHGIAAAAAVTPPAASYGASAPAPAEAKPEGAQKRRSLSPPKGSKRRRGAALAEVSANNETPMSS